MRFSLEYSRDAQSYLRRASPALRTRIAKRMYEICDDPLGARLSKPLHGSFDGTRSTRVGEVRVLFRVFNEQLVVVVVEVGPRGDVYKS